MGLSCDKILYYAFCTAMESDEEMVMIPRLNALVRQADLCKLIAILEAIQKMVPSENQALPLRMTSTYCQW